MLVTLVDEMAKQQVQRTQLTTDFVGGNILDVSHMAHYKHQAASHDALVLAHQEELDLLGKARHQQLHLGHRVDGSDIVVFSKDIGQQFPVFAQDTPVAVAHAVDAELILDGLLGTTQTQLAHTQRIGHRHHAAHTTCLKASTGTEQRIQVFLRRTVTIYIRYRLVDHAARLKVIHIPQAQVVHHLQHLLCRNVSTHYEAAVGQTVVTAHAMRLLVVVRREQPYEVRLVIDHQRAV